MDYVASRRSLLLQKGFGLSKTYGKSMRPLIWGRCHCVVVVPLKGEPAIGDLLLFVRKCDGEERNIVHRLVEISQTGESRLYITRGDNCLGCEYVRRSEIIGRVAEIHRMTGIRPWYAIPWKKFSVTDSAYLRYMRFWNTMWPLRRVWYRLRACCVSCLRRVSVLKTDR